MIGQAGHPSGKAGLAAGIGEPAIEAGRLAALYGQLPVAAVIGPINALLMTALHLALTGDRRAFAWLFSVLLIGGLRFAAVLAWRRDPHARDRRAFWGALAGAGAFASGLGFGLGAVWLWPPQPTLQLVWLMLVGGMCAGAVAHHHACFRIVLSFLVPALLPLLLRFAFEDSELGLAAAAMVLVFLAAISAAAWRASRVFTANLRLRLDLERQAAALAEANQQLREEMARRLATEASLRQAQKMEAVGQFTGGIAHDFNNLLTVVLGSLALLRKRLPPGDARAARLLENAQQGAERGAALTRRLLAFGRRQAAEPALIALPDLVQGMADLLRGALGGGVHLRLAFPPDLPPVLADPNQLELALLNLVANARDAMPAGGEIVISGAERPAGPDQSGAPGPASHVVLSVSDAGEGMDAATLDRALEPFFTTKEAGRGTGLGLPMVQAFAAEAGGRLVLRSAPGRGTVAELWLPPAALLPPRTPPSAAEPPADQRRAAVLLVEVDPLVRASTAAMLEEIGHAVLEAGSGSEALERLRTGTAADLVITDHAMPGMTGLQLAAAIRHVRPGLPVLLTTGLAEPQGPALDHVARLAKPFTPEALARATAACLAATAPG